MKAISQYFISHGIDPFLAGLICGIILCAIARVGLSRKRSEFANPSEISTDIQMEKPVKTSGLMTKSVKIRLTNNGKEIELDDHISGQISDAIRKGQKIEAIKILREASGLDLKGAKDLVEVLEKSNLR